MAKNTSRDKIWTAAIDIRDDMADPDTKPLSSYVSSFRVPEIKEWLEHHERDVPSEKTISDALDSMAEAGVIEQHASGGHGRWARYKPPADMLLDDPEKCNYCKNRFGITGADHTEITIHNRNSSNETMHFCRDCLAAYPRLADRDQDALKGDGNE